MKHIVSRGKGIIFLLIPFIIELTSCSKINKERSRQGEQLKSSIDSLDASRYITDRDLLPYLRKELTQFYENRNYEPAWSKRNRLDQVLLDSLITAIGAARTEGLEPDDYNASTIRQLQNDARKGKLFENKTQELVEADLYATAQYLTYAAHLRSGRINPGKLDKNWIIQPRKANLAKHLEEALTQKRIGQSLQNLLPKYPGYNQLKAQLAQYRSIEEKGGWPSVPSAQNLKPKRIGPEVAALRRRLAFAGLADTTTGQMDVFDLDLLSALKSFQMMHSLDTTGVVDSLTLEALNTPVQQVIETIRVNMERIRWMPDQFGERFVLVNVPSFMLRVYEQDQEAMNMKIVVGNEFTSTPVLNDTLEFVIFSPTWTLTDNIARKEILPHLKQDPGYLERHNMAIYNSWNEDAQPLDPGSIDWQVMAAEDFTYRVVQKPGEGNPLGGVKFMFPNKLSIYLHDTNEKHWFTRINRAASHGCIRVEKPAELAAFLLKDNKEWTPEKIDEAMHQEEQKWVKLDPKTPISIVYLTAWVDEKGRLNQGRDLYGYDALQIKAIKQKEKVL